LFTNIGEMIVSELVLNYGVKEAFRTVGYRKYKDAYMNPIYNMYSPWMGSLSTRERDRLRQFPSRMGRR
jgi:hypothetical protein